MKTWILVADEGRARLFAGERLDGELLEVAGFAHPAAHHPESEAQDRLPRVQESVGSARHAIQPRTSAEDKQADAFARALGEVLEDGRVQARYERLILVAAPRFLGRLRSALDPQVARLVSHSADMDISKAGLDEIRRELQDLLAS